MTCSLSMICTTAAALFVAEPSLLDDELQLTPSSASLFDDSSTIALDNGLLAAQAEASEELERPASLTLAIEREPGRDRPATGWAAAHSGIFLGLQLGALLVNPPDLWPSGRVPDPEQFERSWTRPPTWDDGDWWVTNYVGHPLMGAYLYVFARRTDHSIFGSFVLSTVSSLTWEYLIEAWWEQPSWTDLLVTSTTGALIGEGMWWVRQRIMADGRVSGPEYVALAIVDPVTFLSEITGL